MKIGNMIPLLAFILIASVSEVFSTRKVVVLSFDGFKPDYYSPQMTPKLDSIKNICAAPSFVVTIFPPVTMATHHSVATGVYPNVHGVYGNQMFDAAGGVKKYEHNHFDDVNQKIIPIWVENQTKNNGKSGVMMWPGGEFEYKQNKALKIEPFNQAIDWTDRGNTIISWIKSDGCNLVMAYFEDYPCYKKSDLDKHIKDHAKRVDDIIEHIRTKIPNDFDIVIMSDHGTSTVPGSHVLMIESIVEDETIWKIVSGPLVFLKIPDQTMLMTVYNKIKTKAVNFKAYKLDNFQGDWYISKVDDLKDVIILVAEPTYTFMKTKHFNKLLSEKNVSVNEFVTLENGYDNDEVDMHSFFVGIGPGFKDNVFLSKSIDIVDIYPALKALLELKGNASEDQDKNTLSAVMKELLEPAVVTKYET